MTQEFYINQNSTLPYLRMELIDDGRYDFGKENTINKAVQDADITFSMCDRDTGEYKILNAEANIVLAKTDSCEERYVLEYQWKPRDVKKCGIFLGQFKIHFNGNIKEEGVRFPIGDLIIPIQEDLIIYIK